MMGLSSASTLENSPLSSSRDVASWVQELQRADQTFYNMMTLEIWSLAQTMDEIQPGFWADYMRNRQTIVQQYIKERRRQDPKLNHPSLNQPTNHRKRSPFGWVTEKPAKAAPARLVASFSEDLERDLPKVTPRSARSLLAKPSVVDSTPLSDVVIIDVFGENEPPTAQSADTARWTDSSTDAQPSISPATPVTAASVHPFEGTGQTATTLTRTHARKATAPTAKVPALVLVKLPHLMRFPVVKLLPGFVSPEATGSLATTAIACWLTRNFLVQAPGAGGQFEIRKRCDRITLEPGQSIVCQLGFQLSGLTSAVQVQLVKSLRSQSQLTATWFEASPTTQASGVLEPAEVMVKLTNRGAEPCLLTAGQAFCRLEFLCPTTLAS